MSPEMNELMGVARHYCRLVEDYGGADNHWLQHVAELLPQLHLAISRLKAVREAGWDEGDGDLDRRFDFFVRLKETLGEKDPYWLEFDANYDYQQMSGSLADDLTDIYWSLKTGLDELTRTHASPTKVFGKWRRGYRMHWGQHLIDAERHLYSLDAKGRL